MAAPVLVSAGFVVAGEVMVVGDVRVGDVDVGAVEVGAVEVGEVGDVMVGEVEVGAVVVGAVTVGVELVPAGVVACGVVLTGWVTVGAGTADVVGVVPRLTPPVALVVVAAVVLDGAGGSAVAGVTPVAVAVAAGVEAAAVCSGLALPAIWFTPMPTWLGLFVAWLVVGVFWGAVTAATCRACVAFALTRALAAAATERCGARRPGPAGTADGIGVPSIALLRPELTACETTAPADGP